MFCNVVPECAMQYRLRNMKEIFVELLLAFEGPKIKVFVEKFMQLGFLYKFLLRTCGLWIDDCD